VPRLEKILKDNIASFWLSKSLDRVNGGYTINFGPKGQPKGPGTKMIVSQARNVWLFSRMARTGNGNKQYLEAADLGYKFLKEKMWDAKNGGFYWEVDATGNQKLKTMKHLYGQAFGLYAISEYYMATRKKEALDFAIRLFELLDAKSHDKTYGGYVEVVHGRTDATLDSRDQASVGPVTEPECCSALVGERARAGEWREQHHPIDGQPVAHGSSGGRTAERVGHKTMRRPVHRGDGR